MKEKIYVKKMSSIVNDLNNFVRDLIIEGVETRNMSLAKHYLYDKCGYDEQTALKVIGGIKHDMGNSRLAKCKFMLGLVRMFASNELSSQEAIDGVNECLKYAASSAHVDEYDNNLNGLSAVEFINRFSSIISTDLLADIKKVSSKKYIRNNSYDIVRIDSFNESEAYGDYVDWCVTYDRGMWNQYTHGGSGVFYFCLREGFEDEERVTGEGTPLDSYGLSMIAVSVNSNRACNTITCRWNHANRGNDHVMDTQQLSDLLGVNFYEVFKPLTPEEIEQNKKNILYEVEEELSAYMGYESPDDSGCRPFECDPDYGDTVEQTVYEFNSDEVEGYVLIDYNWSLICNDIFDDIGYREGDCIDVEKGNEYNFVNIANGSLVSNEWYKHVRNHFRYGFALCKKDNLWNVLLKDGSYLFNDWFLAIEIKGTATGNIKLLCYYKNGGFMYFSKEGKPYFDEIISEINSLNNNILAIKFNGEDFYQLYDAKTLDILAPYRIYKLTSLSNDERYSEICYRIGSRYIVTLEDGNSYFIDGNCSLYDMNGNLYFDNN